MNITAESPFELPEPQKCFGSGYECGLHYRKKVAGFDDASIVVVVGADRAKGKWKRTQKPSTETICLCRDEDTDLRKDTVKTFEEDTAHGRAKPGFYLIGSAGTSASSTKVRKVLRECFEDADAGVDWPSLLRLGPESVRQSIASGRIEQLRDMGVCTAAQDVLFEYYLKNVRE